MFQFLKPNPLKRLQKEYQVLQTAAFQAQRNGDIRGYADLTAKAEAVDEKIQRLQSDADH